MKKKTVIISYIVSRMMKTESVKLPTITYIVIRTLILLMHELHITNDIMIYNINNIKYNIPTNTNLL